MRPVLMGVEKGRPFPVPKAMPVPDGGDRRKIVCKSV